MVAAFLVPEVVAREDGAGPVVDLGAAAGKSVLLTLGITRILEQESLDLSIWGSADGQNWGAKPLQSFPQKFYCGTYSLLIDLSDKPDIRYLQARWKMGRWGRGELKPMFGFYVFAEEVGSELLASATV